MRATDRVKGQPRVDGATEVRVPVGRPGNTVWDRKWMDAHARELEPIDDDDDGIPFGSRTRWSGKAQDKGSEWQIPEPKDRCIGIAFIRDLEGRRIVDADNNPLTRACHRWPIRGGTVCIKHGGSIEAVRKAAQMRLLAAADAVSGRLIELATNPKTPPKEQVMAINSILDRAGVKAGVDVSVAVPEWQHVLRDLFEGNEDEPEPTHTVGVTRRRPRRGAPVPKADG